MKKLLTLSIVFLFIVFSGCNDSDDFKSVPIVPPAATSIQGEWKLVNVSGGLAGINDDFTEGTIMWKFNNDQTVTIINNNTDENKQDIFESNTYSYTFNANEATPELCSQTIRIDGVDLGCYSLSPNQFTMSQIESDGFLIKLIK